MQVVSSHLPGEGLRIDAFNIPEDEKAVGAIGVLLTGVLGQGVDGSVGEEK